MKKIHRISKTSDFKAVYRNGVAFRLDGISMYALSSSSQSRLGVVVSRKFGNAVVRNIFKRRMRYFFDSFCKDFCVDFVFVARSRAFVKQEYRHLVEKLLPIVNSVK